MFIYFENAVEFRWTSSLLLLLPVLLLLLLPQLICRSSICEVGKIGVK